jgi:hypothetical protein
MDSNELLPWGYEWPALHAAARRAAAQARPRFVAEGDRAEIALDGILVELATRQDYPAKRDLVLAGIASLNVADAEVAERVRGSGARAQ